MIDRPIDSPQSPPPSEGGTSNLTPNQPVKGLLGIIIFLCSESMMFVSLFVAYIVLRLTTPDWLPPGISGPQLSPFTLTNTLILLSSSFVIYFAERALKRHHIKQFRLLWLITTGMGTYFLIGQGVEWHNLNFGLTAGLMGGTFYLLTGFHGLHVLAGILLQLLMLVRSFLPGNYRSGHWGASGVALFWHFVDGIWLILFSLLYLWQAS